MSYRVLLLAGLLLPANLIAPALLAQGRPAPAIQSLNYEDCLGLARTNPEEGFAQAQTWRATGGGLPASHCAALALFQLGHYGDAADKLESLLPEAERQVPHLVPDILSQAANAWLLANIPDRARKLLDLAIQAQPNRLELRLDRAQALAELNDYPAARADLDVALSLDPTRDDALALRAAARRLTGDLPGALEDAELALALNRRNVEALLERGILRAQAGDRAGARADLIQVRMIQPDGAAAEAAARQIEAMDVKQ